MPQNKEVRFLRGEDFPDLEIVWSKLDKSLKNDMVSWSTSTGPL